MIIVDVLGYSERGIFNSIVFNFKENSVKISDFFKILQIEDKSIYEKNLKYTFLIEQSFADFGSSDLVIIAESSNQIKIVVFIEGKVKTSQLKFSLEKHFSKLKNCESKFKGISSNIFVQLYYKYLLYKILENNKDDTTSLKINNIFKKDKDNPRKIGNNKIVHKAIEKIRNANNVYFVAILPEKIQNISFQNNLTELNKTVFKEEKIPIQNFRNVYWGIIEDYFANDFVKENFLYNKGQIY